MIRRPPRSTLFPSTPLFRSRPTPPSQAPSPPAFRARKVAPAKVGPVRRPADSMPTVRHSEAAHRPPWSAAVTFARGTRSEEHTSELQSLAYLVCRLLLEKKK